MGLINGIIIYKFGKRRGRKKAEKRIARGAQQCPDFVDNSEYEEEELFEPAEDFETAEDVNAGPAPWWELDETERKPRTANFGRKGI